VPNGFFLEHNVCLTSVIISLRNSKERTILTDRLHISAFLGEFSLFHSSLYSYIHHVPDMNYISIAFS
jgi:hypothetical protein